MGYPVNKAIALTNKFDEISSFEWNADWVAETPVDYTRRPENEVLRLAEELNTMNVRRLKAAYLPVFRGFFNYSEVLYRNNLFKDQIPWYPTTVTGLSLNVPIFDGLFRSSQIQRAQIDLQETQVQKAQFYEGMELQVRNARVNLQNAYETNRSRERSFALSQEIYRTAQIKFREGVGSSLELTQAESDMLTAQSNYIQSLYDMIVAKADLDQALGN